MPPPALDKGRENDVPGLGAVCMALSSAKQINIQNVLTHEDICDSLLVNFEVVDPTLLSQGSALEQPGRLVLRVFIKHLIADLDALVILLSIEAGSSEEKWVH